MFMSPSHCMLNKKSHVDYDSVVPDLLVKMTAYHIIDSSNKFYSTWHRYPTMHYCVTEMCTCTYMGYGTGAGWGLRNSSFIACVTKLHTHISSLENWGINISLFYLHLEYDDVIKWNHFLRYCPFVQGIRRWPVNSPHKGQWRGAFMFSLICAWTNGWANNWDAGDFRRRRAHYDVTVMKSNATHISFAICGNCLRPDPL